MLRVIIELSPGGFDPLRRTIASMRISNLSELADVSDYLVEVMERQNPLTGSPPYSADCVVAAHDRRQPVWRLLERACREIAQADRVEL